MVTFCLKQAFANWCICNFKQVEYYSDTSPITEEHVHFFLWNIIHCSLYWFPIGALIYHMENLLNRDLHWKMSSNLCYKSIYLKMYSFLIWMNQTKWQQKRVTGQARQSLFFFLSPTFLQMFLNDLSVLCWCPVDLMFAVHSVTGGADMARAGAGWRTSLPQHSEPGPGCAHTFATGVKLGTDEHVFKPLFWSLFSG